MIILGVGGITHVFAALTNYMIAGELGDILEEYRMKRKVSSLREHYVVCGFGRVGQEVCTQLGKRGSSLW